MSGSIRPPFPSAPSDPSLRRLGVGPPGGRSRPIRAQLIVVVVLGLMLLAVPLYLWRRPSLAPKPVADPSAHPSASSVPSGAPIVPPSLPDSKLPEPDTLKLSAVRKVRCGATARQSSESENCDSLAYFEKALIDAVKTTGDCAPRSAKPGTINFVLEIDFTRKHLHVFPGASGDWRGPKARRATKCAIKALPTPDWGTLVHQYRYYAIAIMVTYPGNISESAKSTRE
jgi:hypothetical protein